MRDKFRNIFMLFGIAVIVIMIFTFDVDMPELLANLKRAGWQLPLIILLWVLIYFMNALSWFVIINDKQEDRKVSFALVYKLTVSGFALNYATPMGLMGGEPYRIMELSPYIGASRATSSVILYVMMHIFSHLCFWASSIVLYLCCYPLNNAVGITFIIAGAAISFLIYLFMRGYKYGLAVKTLRICCRLPFVKNKARSFMQKQEETLVKIDRQIGQLHEHQSRQGKDHLPQHVPPVSEKPCKLLPLSEEAHQQQDDARQEHPHGGEPYGADIIIHKQVLAAGAGKAPAHCPQYGAQEAPRPFIECHFFLLPKQRFHCCRSHFCISFSRRQGQALLFAFPRSIIAVS